MTDILLTNDDGYSSIGFYPLLRELSKDFDVVAVAPNQQKSWLAKSITSKKDMMVEKVKLEDKTVFTMDGTPADCVQIGLYDLVESRPRFVVSGINIGVNTGHGRILSSGTAGAGMEAVIDGVKAISSSLHIPPEVDKDLDFYNPINYSIYENAAKVTAKIIRILFHKQLADDVDLLSINMLQNATVDNDFEITSLDRQPYGRLFHKIENRFVHKNPILDLNSGNAGTDTHALGKNKISITPVSLELTSKKSKQILSDMIRSEW